MVDWVERVDEYQVKRRPIQRGASMPMVRGVGLHATDDLDVRLGMGIRSQELNQRLL
jgi:hypothetical protein